MKKFVLCLAALVGLALVPSSADAVCPRLRAPIRVRVVAPVVQRVVAVHAPAVVAIHAAPVVAVQRVVVAQHIIAEPIRAFSVVSPVVVGYDYAGGYSSGASASLLAEELRLERLRREQLSAGDIDAKLAKFKAEVVAELKLALSK